MARALFLILFIFISLDVLATDISKPIKVSVEQYKEGVYVKLDIPSKWYVYANKQGDGGLPLHIEIKGLPKDNYKILWPEPQIHIDKILNDEFKNYVYKGKVTIPVVVNSYSGEELEVKVVLGACEKLCISQTEVLKVGKGISANAVNTWLLMIMFAFIGGLILNIMPCVLPVLALKLLNIVKYSGLKHNQVRISLFATSFGILASFWVIAFVTMLLRELGVQFGWGFQFQNPPFLLFLIIVLFIYFLILIKDFEINLPHWISSKLTKNHQGLAGSFLTGAFATLLATPCTAPFISASVAFALSGTYLKIFVIYTFMGLGMGFPYYLIGMHQAFLKLIPKPGAWMVKVKRLFAALIFITIAWLISVLVSQYYVEKNLVISPGGWEKFSEQSLKRYVAQDKIVLVDVTATWCLTCKFNKILVLNQKDIVKFLSDNKVVTMRADFTNRSNEIAQYIKSHDRYGIPLNVVYGPNARKGIVVSEILSKEALIDAINRSKRP